MNGYLTVIAAMSSPSYRPASSFALISLNTLRVSSTSSIVWAAVQTILNNEETYRGHYKYGENSVENQHEAILKED